mgnify:CR=1 FL=1
MRTQRTRKNAGAERASSSLRRNIEKIERDKADLKVFKTKRSAKNVSCVFEKKGISCMIKI